MILGNFPVHLPPRDLPARDLLAVRATDEGEEAA